MVIIHFNIDMTISVGQIISSVITTLGLLASLYFSTRAVIQDHKQRSTPQVIAYPAQIDVVSISKFLVIKNTGPLTINITNINIIMPENNIDKSLEHLSNSDEIWLVPGQSIKPLVEIDYYETITVELSYKTQNRRKKYKSNFIINFKQFYNVLWSKADPLDKSSEKLDDVIRNSVFATLKEKL